MGFKFPYGAMQQLNLDWFIKQFNKLRQDWATAEEGIAGALQDEIDRAETAMSDVFTARDTAVAAKNDALTAKSDALQASANAAQYWQNAANSASAAAGSAGTALQAAEDAETAEGNAQTAEANAAASNTQAGVNKFMAEAWAAGTMNGTPVGSGTIQYQNNAKYYAQQASGDAAQTALDRAAVAQDKDDTDAIKDNANAAALRAEGWADGTQNGTPVTSGSPYYENNAKYYKEAAEDVLESIPPDYSELAAEVSEQSEKIDNVKSDIEKIATITVSPNLYNPDDSDVLTDKYLNPNGSLETLSGRTVTGFIPVTAGQKVVFSREGSSYTYSASCFYQSNKTSVVPGGDYNQGSVTVPNNASYVRITFASNLNDVQIECNTDGSVSPYQPYGEEPKEINSDVKIPGVPPYKKPFAIKTGNLGNGDYFKLLEARCSARKNQRFIFSADITSFTSISIGKATDVGATINAKRNTFVIDGTNINYYFEGTTTPSATVAHGLTISENIQVILEESNENTCKLTLISDGESFTQEFSYRIYEVGSPYILSASTLTNCTFVWSCIDFDRHTWIFGDSYVQYATDRWAYYLAQYGYDVNALIDGFSGEGSLSAYPSYKNLLQYGTPKTAIWCLGMNDLSDSGDTPSANWVTGRNAFLAYCEINDVTPIFATIPTVPSINNEAKNAWIRTSGYRYIDFAEAVGASPTGEWFDGMLNTIDNIHPTVKGAKALFAKFICDYPEIMIGCENTPIVEQSSSKSMRNIIGVEETVKK